MRSERTLRDDSRSGRPRTRAPHLSAADGQSPVEHGPGHGLLAARRRHGAHVAVITVELPR